MRNKQIILHIPTSPRRSSSTVPVRGSAHDSKLCGSSCNNLYGLFLDSKTIVIEFQLVICQSNNYENTCICNGGVHESMSTLTMIILTCAWLHHIILCAVTELDEAESVLSNNCDKSGSNMQMVYIKLYVDSQNSKVSIKKADHL